jgi:integrase/recombinase XerD
MKELIDSFLDYLSVERGLSRNTIAAYRQDLNIYLDLMIKRGINALSRISKNDIVEFMLFEKEKGVSPNSISAGWRQYACFTVFFPVKGS